jgi:5,10-methylenetetrahydromethanopterin reductase
MQFGVVFPSRIDNWQHVRRAEELGYSHAWFYDSQMIYSDVYMTMALAAEHTSRIVLGTGVAVPGGRSAPVTAAAIATLNQMAPGRVILGLSSGHTARRTMGLPPVRHRELRETVHVCRALLDGKATRHEQDGQTRTIRFLHPEGGYINLRDRIPIWVGAGGPLSLKLAGRAADGVIMFGWNRVPGLPDTLAAVRAAASAAGRDPAAIDSVLFVGVCVLRPGERHDSERVRRAVGPFVTSPLHAMADIGRDPATVPGPLGEVYRKYLDRVAGLDLPPEERYLELHTGHLVFLRPWEEDLLTPEVLRTYALVGTPDEIAAQVRRVREMGLGQLAVQPVPGDEGVIEDFWQAAAPHAEIA